MKRSITLTLLMICILIQGNILFGQADTMEMKPKYGGYAHFLYDINSTNFTKLPGVPSCCPNYTFGAGPGFAVGGVYDMPIDPKLQLSLRAGFFQTYSFFVENEEKNIIVDGVSQTGLIEHSLDVGFSGINITPMVSYEIIENLYAHAGADISLLISTSYDQIEKIIDPPNRGTFANGLSYRNKFDGSIEESNPFNLGVKVGAGYELQMNKRKSLFLVPEFFYTFNFTSPVKDLTWTVHRFEAGISIKYRTPPPPPPPPPPPANSPYPELPLPKAPPLLTAEITALQIDSLGNGDYDFRIRIEDFITLNMRPLLSYVFFDSNSAVLPSRYNKIEANETNTFGFERLHGLDAMETYYNVLNIFGMKLRLNPDTKITLLGSNDNTGIEKNNKVLSKNRAVVVRDYLRDTWGIDESRMKIKARNLPKPASKIETIEGREENRRVEIISSDIVLMEPIVTVDTMRIITTSKIQFELEYQSAVGIDSWSVVAAQNRNELISWSGKGAPPEELYWEIRNDDESAPKKKGTVYYYLTLTDEFGTTVTSTKHRLPVDQLTIDRKRLEQRSDKEFEYYRLILFDYGKSKLGSGHRKVVDIVKNRVNKNSTVVISGHTDSMGETKINKRISNKRAQAVARRLKLKGATVQGVGEDELLYDNSLPEGRFYCRTVMITIETPIDENGN